MDMGSSCNAVKWSRLDCNSSILLNDDSPDKFKNKKGKTLERKYELIGQHTEIWLSVLDYIIRLIYQIGGLYTERDVSCLCKHFLKKLYQYFYYSPVVHQSALKFLSSIARNTSSIQPIFDYLLIPKLTVDLVDGRLKDNCSQCSDIKRYVKEFLLNMKKYFNHYHQYGKLEVVNRLHPLKPSGINYRGKHPSHILCPKLFNTFLLEFKGLDYMLSILSQPQQGNVYLYTIASLCTIYKSLQKEYDIKINCPCVNNRDDCLFSEKNKKKVKTNSDFSSCMVHMEKDKIVQLNCKTLP
ncbi:hypothetical protein Anas_11655 [Armadillidium nasatum]|uniref:Uncharacterized protein n=1 Tax=Armadillidium nasatum TaxID=96803 RepID=A0A5N5TI16_9CRUS|nr:hypothetical protein Anas_11655 [Armadillidium nasatum]